MNILSSVITVCLGKTSQDRMQTGHNTLLVIRDIMTWQCVNKVCVRFEILTVVAVSIADSDINSPTFGCTCCLHLCRRIASWRWRCDVLPKLLQIFTGLYGVTFGTVTLRDCMAEGLSNVAWFLWMKIEVGPVLNCLGVFSFDVGNE